MHVETKRILIVDDDIESLSTIYISLLPLDYNLEAAMDGGELLPRLERFKPHLLLLSTQVGKFNVSDLAHWLQKNKDCRLMAIKWPEDEAPQWLSQLPVDDVLLNPIEAKDLLEKLQVVLSL